MFSTVNKILVRTLSSVKHYFIMIEFMSQIIYNIRKECLQNTSEPGLKNLFSQ